MGEIALFSRLGNLLYIQIKGEDAVWSLISYNAYQETPVFLGFADNCIPVTERIRKEDLKVIRNNYAIKDKDSVDILHNKYTGNLDLNYFRLTKGALKNTGIFSEYGELMIMSNNDCVSEDISIVTGESTITGKTMKVMDTIKTTTGKIIITTDISTVECSRTLKSYSFEYDNVENLGRYPY